MPLLSLAMIVKNEERTLERVLKAASQFCDEMLVVDTGSTDRTVEIALACGARVEHFSWIDHFAAARNYSFSLCTGEWILWLDADDVLPEATIEAGKNIKTKLLPVTKVDVVRAPYHYSYDDNGTPTVIHGRERFMRRSAGLQWIGRVHEVIENIGDSWVTCPEFAVEHRTAPENMDRKTGRNLRIYEENLDLDNMSTHELYLYAGELRGAGRHADAIPVLARHMKKWPSADYDLFEEPYIVRIDMIACMRAVGDQVGALTMAGNAIAYNGARAEAYVLAGLTHYEMGNMRAAFPSFLAGAACKPPRHGGLVYETFYSTYVHDMIKECKAFIAQDEEKQQAGLTVFMP